MWGRRSVIIALILVALAASEPTPGRRPSTDPTTRAIVNYGNLPLQFVANHGQTDEQVRFLARGRGYGLFLTSTESVLVLRPPAAGGSGSGAPGVLRMKLLDASPQPSIVGREEMTGRSHYFLGNDPRRWRTDVPQFARVEYRDVYPRVDLAYYGRQGQLEYDFVVNPGADPRQIRLGIEGAEKVHIDAAGDLVLSLSGGDVVQRAPVAYQEADGARQPVASRFVLRGRTEVGFDVGRYDSDRPLVFDPVLRYSAYLGGSDFDQANSVALDTSGNAYVAGVTLSTNFPTASPLQPTTGGFYDVFVTKINAAGTALVYSTYLGGSHVDEAKGIAVDAAGSAYVTGRTISINFPTVAPFQAAHGGNLHDVFLTKLNPAGSAITYSTYLGGSGNDIGTSIAVDPSGNAYVAGSTDSINLPTASPIQPTNAGSGDAFVVELNPAGSALVYGTYLGGTGADAVHGVAVDPAGQAHVVGLTFSSDFPTANPLQAAKGGDGDAFVGKLAAGGSAFVYSTYLGGSRFDQGSGIAVDPSGNAYITGFTDSTDWPTAAPVQAANAGGGDAFVAMLDAAGSALVYSSYLGGSNLDEGVGIAAGASGAHVVGHTGSANFPTHKPYQGVSGGNFDVFVTSFDPAGSLVYSTYLGGANSERGLAIAADGAGASVVAGWTESNDFPTAGPIHAAHGGNGDAFVARISVTPRPPADFNGDGKSDILWQHVTNGFLVVWYMNGVTSMGTAVLNPGWLSDLNQRIVGVADFNGDDQPDILWQHLGNGTLSVWYMNGVNRAQSVLLQPSQAGDANWRIAGTGNFDDDGKPDILWRHQPDGQLEVWYMDGVTRVGSATLDPQHVNLNRTMAASADFNDDGKPDLLWQHVGTGRSWTWYMDGVTQTGTDNPNPAALDRTWSIRTAADYNFDGKPDILWQRQGSGTLLMEYMDGMTRTGLAALNPAQVSDPNWKIVGPR